MAGDDLLDAYIAEALKSTGTRKAPNTEGPPIAAARQSAGTMPPPAGRPRTASAPPHSVVARTSSQVRTPTTPPNTARAAPSNAVPVVGRTPTPSAVRLRSSSVPPTFDDSPLAIIDRARPPKPTPPPPAIARAQQLARSSSTMLPQASELASDFDEDTIPEAQAMAALTDQDDRGVRRS